MKRALEVADALIALGFTGAGIWYAIHGDFPRASWFSMMGMGNMILSLLRNGSR
jgi:hypothetical protein